MRRWLILAAIVLGAVALLQLLAAWPAEEKPRTAGPALQATDVGLAPPTLPMPVPGGGLHCRPAEPEVSASPSSDNAREALAGSVLRIEHSTDGKWPARCGALRIADGRTAEPLGLAPMNVGHWQSTVLSPDKRLLAAVIGGGQELGMGRLHIYDMETWTERLYLPDTPLFGRPVWSPDGASLHMIQGDAFIRHGVRPRFYLWSVDVATGSASSMDLDFTGELSISDDGRLGYVFGFKVKPTSLTVGSMTADGGPFLAVVDVVERREVARRVLPDIAVGQAEVSNMPAAVLDDKRRRFYIAHADSDKVTVVDLDRLSVAATPERRTGWLSRVATDVREALVDRAEAKSANYNVRHAYLSRDGRHLFTSGYVSRDEDGIRPLGLKAIDTRSLKVVFEEEGVSSFLPSADGRLLFGTGRIWTSGPEYNEDITIGSGLKVIDTHRLKLVASINPDRDYRDITLSRDGRYLHLLSYAPAMLEARRRIALCTAACHDVDVLDTTTLTFVGSLTLDANGVSLEPRGETNAWSGTSSARAV